KALEILKKSSPRDAPDIPPPILKTVLAALAKLEMQPVQTRVPITERIRFQKEVPPGVLKPDGGEIAIASAETQAGNWQDIVDEYLISNKKKLHKIFGALERSYKQYRYDLVKSIIQALNDNESNLSKAKIEQVADSLQPALLIVQVLGYTDTD